MRPVAGIEPINKINIFSRQIVEIKLRLLCFNEFLCIRIKLERVGGTHCY